MQPPYTHTHTTRGSDFQPVVPRTARGKQHLHKIKVCKPSQRDRTNRRHCRTAIVHVRPSSSHTATHTPQFIYCTDCNSRILHCSHLWKRNALKFLDHSLNCAVLNVDAAKHGHRQDPALAPRGGAFNGVELGTNAFNAIHGLSIKEGEWAVSVMACFKGLL